MRALITAAVLAGTCLTSPAFAGSATPEGARALSATLESYLGKTVMTGGGSRVTVNGTADGYDVSFDLGQIAAPLESAGVKLAPALLTFTLYPLADGTWRYRQAAMPRIAVTHPKGSFEVQYDGFSSEGVFDPKLGAFTTYSVKVAATRSQSSDGASSSRTEQADLNFSGTAKAAAKGVDATLSQLQGSTRHVLQVNEDGDTTAISVDVVKTAADGTISGLMSREILDLWSFAVTHATPEAAKAAVPQFKTKVLALFPLWQRLSIAVGVDSLSVDTPVGQFGVNKFGFTETLNGAVRDGLFEMGVSAGTLDLPRQLLPEWATGLVPSSTQIGLRVTGYDLETFLKEAVNRFDVNAEKPVDFSDDEAMRLLLPKGELGLVLPKGALAAPLYSVDWEGAMTINPTLGAASGKARVSARGIDEVIAALTRSKAPDAMSVVTGLYGAKALAKPGAAPGEYIWEIEGSQSGVTINGNPLPRY